MDPELVIGILERIGELLSEGAQQAWTIAMNQVAVDSLLRMRTMWACIVAAALGLVMVVSGWLAMANNAYGDEGGLGGVVVGSVVLVACALAALSAWNEATAMAMNPEYYAIQILLRLAGR